MDKQNSKALVVAFYLSKFDKTSYANLNFGNATNTHKIIGEILSVNPNSIKNMREEFDPYHPNDRVGWYQRPLRPSRQKVFDSFSELSEHALRTIVLGILNEDTNDSLSQMIELVVETNDSDSDDHDSSNSENITYSSRGITGEKAEEYFKNNWKSHYPFFSEIENKTKDGCGYDFKIISDNAKKLIEVKGMKNLTGGILLTSKEWETAKEYQENFDLFIVSNINETPSVQIITNPAAKLEPKETIQTVIQVNYTVSNKQLEQA